MRVLVEPSDYLLRNAGDTAMLRVACTRLSELWPDGVIRVFNRLPAEFPRWAPNVVAISVEPREAWLRDEDPDGGFVAEVRRANLFVVAGMGGLTDAFPEYALALVRTIRLAISQGVPVALMGQGIGPMQDGPLLEAARTVLPSVDLIALRERAGGAPLLHAMGVDPSRIRTTGDDAIDLVIDRPAGMGHALGVNVRAADYSAVGAGHAALVRRAVGQLVQRFGAPVVAIPISRVPGEEDDRTIGDLLDGIPHTGGPIEATVSEDAHLESLLRRVEQCRVIITGSYHAGVFGLAAGIPVIGIAASEYYRQKFAGLEDLFGEGCRFVMLGGSAASDRIYDAAVDLWNRADEVRPHLRSAARRQHDWSRRAYQDMGTMAARRAGT